MSSQIEFVRGDTHTVRFMLRSGEQPLLLAEGDVGRLRVYDGDACVVSKSFTAAAQDTDAASGEYGAVTVNFLPGDTEGIRPTAPPGSVICLSYELELLTADGVASTPVIDAELLLRVDRITPGERSDEA